MNAIVFNETEYEDMLRYNRLRNLWVRKYGTTRFFDRWYSLMLEVVWTR